MSSSASEVAVEIRDTIAVVRLMRPAAQRAERRADGRDRRRVRRTAQVGFDAPCSPAVATTSAPASTSRRSASATPWEGLHHSRSWHRILGNLEFGRIPIVRAARCGGRRRTGAGVELPHPRGGRHRLLRTAEGSRGIFVGGGGSVRIPKLIGAHRMLDMMLTGRVYKAAEAVPLGFAQYHVPAGRRSTKRSRSPNASRPTRR